MCAGERILGNIEPGFGLNAMNSNYFRVAFSYVKNTLYRTVLYLY